jgi:hypothetical protein
MAGITVILHEDRWTSVIISSSVLLGTRKDSNKNVEAKTNTNILNQILFLKKIVSFMR